MGFNEGHVELSSKHLHLGGTGVVGEREVTPAAWHFPRGLSVASSSLDPGVSPTGPVIRWLSVSCHSRYHQRSFSRVAAQCITLRDNYTDLVTGKGRIS